MACPVILITGASRGLGAAIVAYLLEHTTANLFLVSRTQLPLEAVKAVHPTRVSFLAVDMSIPANADAAVQAALTAFGKLDAVVLNHGVLEPVGRLEEADTAAWRELFATNYFSCVDMVRAALPALRAAPTGRVVMVSSIAANIGFEAWGAYGGSKAAMNQLCATLATEEPDVVAVAVSPGVVDTGMQREIRDKHGASMGAGHASFCALKAEGQLLKVRGSTWKGGGAC